MDKLEKFKTIKPGDVIYNKTGFKMTVLSAKEEDGIFTIRLREDGSLFFKFDEKKGLMVSNMKDCGAIDDKFDKPQKYSNLIIGTRLELSDGRIGRLVGHDYDFLRVDVKDPKRPALAGNTILFNRDGKGPGGLKITKEIGW